MALSQQNIMIPDATTIPKGVSPAERRAFQYFQLVRYGTDAKAKELGTPHRGYGFEVVDWGEAAPSGFTARAVACAT